MERVALAVLLVLSLPVPAFAQRIEVAVLAGLYQPVPTQRSGSTGNICDSPPCPTHYDETRRAGSSFGAQLSLHLGPRFGIDATIHQARATGSVTQFDPSVPGVLSRSAREFRATFVSLQSHVRSTLKESVEFSIAAGPGISSPLGSSRSRFAFVITGVIRGHLSRLGVFQVRLSDAHMVGPVRGADRNYLTAHAGLGWAVRT